MKLFDSHCHLDDPSFRPDFDDVLKRAADHHVAAVMVVGITLESSRRAVFLAERYPALFASVGIHPHDAKQCSPRMLNDLITLAENQNVAAWGETGLDFNRMFSPKDVQEKWFVRQMETAAGLKLPLIFHERDSGGRFYDLLSAHYNPAYGGVVHCFSGTRTELFQYLDMGLFIGLTGILTIRSRGARLRELVKAIPLDKILIETDAPYLTPAPERNKSQRNEPAFVHTVFNALTGLLSIDPEALADQLWKNTTTLFSKTSKEQ